MVEKGTESPADFWHVPSSCPHVHDPFSYKLKQSLSELKDETWFPPYCLHLSDPQKIVGMQGCSSF